MIKRDAIAIRIQDGSVIKVEDFFAVSDAYDGKMGYLVPEEVIWSDGSWSFAKGWWFEGRAVRVGAGAYGDMEIIERMQELGARW